MTTPRTTSSSSSILAAPSRGRPPCGSARGPRELKGITVGWRFISLKFINEGNDLPAAMVEAQHRGLRYHRICAAAREKLGNVAVARLYQAWGERYWYSTTSGDLMERFAAAAEGMDLAQILQDLELPRSSWPPLTTTSWMR